MTPTCFQQAQNQECRNELEAKISKPTATTRNLPCRDKQMSSTAHTQKSRDSLSELNQQLQQHPSILPVDFDITNCGDLVLNVPPPVDIYDTAFDREYHQNNHEFEDQRVPVAKLSHSSSGDTSSPQVN
ncbi:unnamed protein product, partial [Timema podura]|nr:unnamed protein product [Timema podura]